MERAKRVSLSRIASSMDFYIGNIFPGGARFNRIEAGGFLRVAQATHKSDPDSHGKPPKAGERGVPCRSP